MADAQYYAAQYLDDHVEAVYAFESRRQRDAFRDAMLRYVRYIGEAEFKELARQCRGYTLRSASHAGRFIRRRKDGN